MAVLLGTHAHSVLRTQSDKRRHLVQYDRAVRLRSESTKYGLQLAESFEYALKQNVRVIMITGWNEWYAGVQKTGNRGTDMRWYVDSRLLHG